MKYLFIIIILGLVIAIGGINQFKAYDYCKQSSEINKMAQKEIQETSKFNCFFIINKEYKIGSVTWSFSENTSSVTTQMYENHRKVVDWDIVAWRGWFP